LPLATRLPLLDSTHTISMSGFAFVRDVSRRVSGETFIPEHPRSTAPGVRRNPAECDPIHKQPPRWKLIPMKVLWRILLECLPV